MVLVVMLGVVMVPEGVSEADTNVVVEPGTRQVVGDTENVVVKVVEMRSAGGGSGYLGLGGVGGAEQGGVGLGVAYSTQGVGEQMSNRWGCGSGYEEVAGEGRNQESGGDCTTNAVGR